MEQMRRSNRNTTGSSAIILLFLAAGLTLTLKPGHAHEIPADVVVQAYLTVEPDRLNLLVRVPLEAMRDIQFPLQGPGYLNIGEAERSIRDAAQIWIADDIHLYERDRELAEKTIAAARVSLPSDHSFRSYDFAYSHVTGPPLPDDTRIIWNQALLDVLIEVPIASADSAFSIEPELARLGLNTVTVVRFVPPDGVLRAFEFTGNPGLVRLDPRWHQAFLRFVGSGFDHILAGIDHLLFVVCLIIPFRRARPIIILVTSFTAGHSITLLASALGLAPKALWFPPLIETLIAASIVYMAIENVFGASWQRRWAIAFGFGLVHGFGFSFALSETLQFAGSHLLTSLLAFNLGVELGQVAIVLLAVPLLNVLFRSGSTERIGTIVLSALVAHIGWHWMIDRGVSLSQYRFPWPVFDFALWATSMRWLVFAAAVCAFGWVALRAWQRLIVERRSRVPPRATAR